VRSLFVRIFLWFWLTLVLALTVVVVSSPFFTRSRPRLAQWEEHSRQALNGGLERLARWVERHPAEAVVDLDPGALRGGRRGGGHGRSPNGHAGPREPVMLGIFDASGAELTGRSVPPELASLALRAIDQEAVVEQRTGAMYLAARPVTAADGRALVVASAVRRPPELHELIEPGALALRLAVITGIAGLLVWALARHLAGPVGVLRSATQDIAAGNLAARVGGRVVRRRDEIGDLARDFDTMAERVEDVVESQRRLLRDVSHELRSPLARLAVAVELGRQRGGAETAPLFDRMERETSRLDDLIGRLLQLARLEGDPGPSERVDLSTLLLSVAADARFEAAPAGLQIVADVPNDLVVNGVEWALRSAVENTLRNAIRHSDEGKTVTLSATRGDGEVRIVVRDEGPGVPEDHLERIFAPFHRVDESRDPSTGGTGLGLAIAARAILAHGGTITASNRQPHGLEVEIALPR
jgi:signal transduction histidine kinase